MNIFVTNICPKKSAEYLDNKRIVKMILESCQMLSTALYKYNITGPYKETHSNHPCTKWVGQSRENYLWLLTHAIELHNIYTKTYNKSHKSSQYFNLFKNNAKYIPSNGLTKFVNCARRKDLGIDFTNENNVFLAYQKYLQERWKRDIIKPKWRCK